MNQVSRCSLQHVPSDALGCVLTIGNFDGVHRGHQAIVSTVADLASAAQVRAVVVTFDPPPDRIVRPDDPPQRITPHERKCLLLAQAGVDLVVTAPTDEAFLAMTPQEFIRYVVMERFAPRCIVEGRNFFFGLGRSGNVDTLRSLGDKEGFAVKVVEPVRVALCDGQHRVSSTLIRRLLREGRVQDAGVCLGRPFALWGQVVAGQGRGRVLEFPTANIAVADQITPGDGVYAGWATICGATYPAAISIGVKPTLGPAERTIEAFLIDEHRADQGDLYGLAIELKFVRRLRDQQKFDGMDALRKQIAKDVESVRRICK